LSPVPEDTKGRKADPTDFQHDPGSDPASTDLPAEPNSRDNTIDPVNQDLYENSSPFTFNGKVVIGIAIILAVSAAGAIAASSMSTSSVIRLSSLNPLVPMGLASQALQGNNVISAAAEPSKDVHVDKKFVLVAHDFGWNGTTGGPTIQVIKGDVVQITVINAGQMAHNFGMGKPSAKAMKIMNETMNMPLDQRVNSIPYDVMAAMPCPDCQKKFDEGHIEMFILPDHQAVTTFAANEAGHFKYFCMVRGHIWMRMSGDLVVLNNPEGISKGGSTT